MPDDERTALRATFDEIPELYRRVRPGYPPEVVDELVDLTGLGPGSRVVEIGCGPGQATVPLAERGLVVTAVELGERLAAEARRNLAGFPLVEVVNADVETWEPTAAGFDAVLAFSSFHWVAADVRYEKAASLLRPGGALGFVSVAHVLPPDGDPFFAEVQADYAALPGGPGPAARNGPPPDPDAVVELSDSTILAELEASGRFTAPEIRHHRWELSYSADEYVELLGTYSDHLALDPAARAALFERIRTRISARPGGRVRRSSLALLYVARRR